MMYNLYHILARIDIFNLINELLNQYHGLICNIIERLIHMVTDSCGTASK